VAEIDLAESPGEARTAVEWLKARLAQMGAVAGEGLAGVAGSVDAAMQSYTLPDGATLEVWSDNCAALSLRGDAGLIAALVADYREAKAHG
jgi:histidine ammonia-lyase